MIAHGSTRYSERLLLEKGDGSTMVSRSRKVSFGPYEVDLLDERLWRGGLPVPLRPKTFAVLRHLLERPGQLVTKQALIGAVWPETFVSGTVLKVCVRELRQ